MYIQYYSNAFYFIIGCSHLASCTGVLTFDLTFVYVYLLGPICSRVNHILYAWEHCLDVLFYLELIYKYIYNFLVLLSI